MRVEDVNVSSVSTLSVGDLKDLVHRASQLFAATEAWRQSIAAGRVGVVKNAGRADVLQAYGILTAELRGRGQIWPEGELDRKVARKRLRGLDVPELPVIPVRENVVALAGAFVAGPRTARGVDVRVDSDELGDEITYEIERRVAELVSRETGLPLVLRRDAEGLAGPVLPLYDLVLVPKPGTADLGEAAFGALAKRLEGRKDALGWVETGGRGRGGDNPGPESESGPRGEQGGRVLVFAKFNPDQPRAEDGKWTGGGGGGLDSIETKRDSSGGKYIMAPSARESGTIQVTHLDEDNNPIGHEEYDSLEEAAFEHWPDLNLSVFQSAKNPKISDWVVEAKANENIQDEIKGKGFVYVSPQRPLSGVGVDGFPGISKDGRVGVLFRDSSLPLDKQEHLNLVPASTKALRAAVKEYVGAGKVIKSVITNLSKPFPAEHAARQNDPGQFDDFRRQNNKFAPGISAIWGIKDGKTKLQSVRFAADRFTPEQAKKWLEDHKMKVGLEAATQVKKLVDTFIKSSSERIVGGVVYGLGSAATADGQGDFVDDPAEIWGALKDWTIRSKGQMKIMHKGEPVPVTVVENMMFDEDTIKGGKRVRKGDWYVSCYIPPGHDDLWQAIQDGDINGFSLAGSGKAEKVGPDASFEKFNPN